jgi:HK97 family phage major capsid protein
MTTGTTTGSDLFVPEILQDAIAGEFAGRTALSGTSAVVMNGSLPETARGGDRLTVPYFDVIGDFDDADVETDALSPTKLTMSSEQSLVHHSGKMVELTDWAKMKAAFADPYAEMAKQFREGFKRRMDKAALAAAIASLPSSMVKDLYSATVPRKIDYDAVVDAKQLWNDEQEDIVLLGAHSKVQGDMLKLKTGDGNPLLTMPQDGSTPRFVGMPVKISDKHTVSSDSPPKYTTLLLKRGAVVIWYNGTPVIETFRDISVPSTAFAIHTWFIAYRYKHVSGGTLPGVVALRTN